MKLCCGPLGYVKVPGLASYSLPLAWLALVRLPGGSSYYPGRNEREGRGQPSSQAEGAEADCSVVPRGKQPCVQGIRRSQSSQLRFNLNGQPGKWQPVVVNGNTQALSH